MKTDPLPEFLIRPPKGRYCDTSLGEALKWWLTIREFYEIPLTTATALIADIDHSALLERLINGKAPLRRRPPLLHSYPDYQTAEKLERGEL